MQGDGRGGMVVRGMGRRGGGGGQRCGGGRQQSTSALQIWRGLLKRLNPKESTAASACRTTNSLSWGRRRLPPRERRTNNYHGNLWMLYLVNVAGGRKYIYCGKKCRDISYVSRISGFREVLAEDCVCLCNIFHHFLQCHGVFRRREWHLAWENTYNLQLRYAFFSLKLISPPYENGFSTVPVSGDTGGEGINHTESSL